MAWTMRKIHSGEARPCSGSDPMISSQEAPSSSDRTRVEGKYRCSLASLSTSHTGYHSYNTQLTVSCWSNDIMVGASFVLLSGACLLAGSCHWLEIWLILLQCC